MQLSTQRLTHPRGLVAAFNVELHQAESTARLLGLFGLGGPTINVQKFPWLWQALGVLLWSV
jgi:hypothetical protein